MNVYVVGVGEEWYTVTGAERSVEGGCGWYMPEYAWRSEWWRSGAV